MVSRFFRILLLLYGVSFTHQASNNIKARILYSWKTVDFLYTSQQSRNIAQQQRLFVPENIVVLDSDYYTSPSTSSRRVFVTTPQFKPGIPATLSEVSTQRNGETNLLRPFPSWDAQRSSTCDGPVSVYRIHIDRCGLLWVLDTGRVDTFTNPRRACRPKLLVYDLNNNDNLLVRYEFPDGSVNDRSNIATIVTESNQRDCGDSVAYIADTNAYGIVIFNLPTRTSWRVEHAFFYPFPDRGTLTIAGVTFDLMDGVFGLALSPSNDPIRKLYFHSFASVREAWIPTSILKNSSLTQRASELRKHFTMSVDAREGQTTLEVMTESGIIIYPVLSKTALACWNSATSFTKQNQHIIYQDYENLQFVSGMKLKDNVLLITTSRLQNYIADVTKTSDVNYRIIVIEDVNLLLKGTPCMN